MKDIEKIVEYILAHPDNYPGAHNEPAARTSPVMKPLETKALMMIMWRALCEYLEEKLKAGKNVNIKGFGAFAYDIESDLPRIAARTINSAEEIGSQRLERKHIHKIQPRFVVDPKLQYHLYHYPGKEQVVKAGSQKSIYQKGFQMIYCNPYPIAAACCIETEVVKDGLQALWAAIIDLIKLDNDINLNFGFCRMVIDDRNLKIRFRTGFETEIKDKEFQVKMKRSVSPCSTFWKTSYQKEWNKSNLGTLLKKSVAGTGAGFWKSTVKK